MSWHYLQGQEEASWEGTCLDGAPSALLSLLPTPEASCLPVNGTECSPPSRCGTMSEPSTASRGADTLTLSAEGSPAKIFPSLEKVTDLTESEADCGPKCPGSLARYNPGSRSWRTAQCSLLGGLTVYSVTFPRWGTMQSGELWERTMPVLRIVGNVFGYWPTPTASQARSEGMIMQMRAKVDAGELTRAEAEAMIQGSLELARMQAWANTPSGNWPTPTCSDAFTDKLKSNQQSEGSMHSVYLSQAVKMWPTPTAQDSKHGDVEPMYSKPGATHTGLLHVHVGGQLNPDWVEFLMNWPIGWTSMEPLNPDRFRAWLLASQSEPTASRPSVTDKFLPPPHSHGIPSTNALERA